MSTALDSLKNPLKSYMKNDRNRQPVKPDYAYVLGQAAFCFSICEWNVVWSCERISPGALEKIVGEELTAGRIAKRFIDLVRNMPKSAGRNELSIIAQEFSRLVVIRNQIFHGKPCTDPNGDARLNSGKVLEIGDLEDAADAFSECSIKVNELLHGFSKRICLYDRSEGGSAKRFTRDKIKFLIWALCPLAVETAMSDELMEELDRSNKGESPSLFGRAEFCVQGSPASVQSKKNVRDVYLASIKKQFEGLKYLLIGELILNVTWLLPAKQRFETDAKSDIDNCIKPIIDAFTGPDGFFIDDCQLRGLYICWRHIESGNERLIFDFEFQGDQYALKDELAFVQLDGALCTPVNLNWPRAAKVMWSAMLAANQKSKAILEGIGISYPAVASFLGGSQPFHRTRVSGFRVLSLGEFVCSSTNVEKT